MTKFITESVWSRFHQWINKYLECDKMYIFKETQKLQEFLHSKVWVLILKSTLRASLLTNNMVEIFGRRTAKRWIRSWKKLLSRQHCHEAGISMFGRAYGDARMPNWPHWHQTPLPGIVTTGLRWDNEAGIYQVTNDFFIRFYGIHFLPLQYKFSTFELDCCETFSKVIRICDLTLQ